MTMQTVQGRRRKAEPTAADKARWAEERQEKVAAAKAALEEGLKRLVTGEDWQMLLETVAKNARHALSPRRYSFRNQMVLSAYGWAGHDVSAVGTFMAWQRAGRCVKKGEKALYILKPCPWTREQEGDNGEKKTVGGTYFAPMAVFAVSQTEGEPLPVAPSLCGEIEDDARFAAHVEELRGVALAIEGQPVSAIDIRPRDTGPLSEDHAEALGWYVPRTKRVVVIDTGNRAAMFKVLCHEVTHALLHGAAPHHEYARNEVEAESSAFVVSRVFGLDTGAYSFPYIASWARGNAAENDPTKVVQDSGERIVRAVNTILAALLGDGQDEPEADHG